MASLIYCEACGREVADNAPTCPKCGAVQTEEGREKGRRRKKTVETIAAAVVLVPATIIMLLVIIGGMLKNTSSSSSYVPYVPSSSVRWDMDQLHRDVERAVRENDNGTPTSMFIPYDGGQPTVVDDPYGS